MVVVVIHKVVDNWTKVVLGRNDCGNVDLEHLWKRGWSVRRGGVQAVYYEGWRKCIIRRQKRMWCNHHCESILWITLAWITSTIVLPALAELGRCWVVPVWPPIFIPPYCNPVPGLVEIPGVWDDNTPLGWWGYPPLWPGICRPFVVPP